MTTSRKELSKLKENLTELLIIVYSNETDYYLSSITHGLIFYFLIVMFY